MHICSHTNTCMNIKIRLTPSTHRCKTTFSLEHTLGPFVFTDFCLLCFLSCPLVSSLVVAVWCGERLGKVGIAFWFPQSLLSGSRQDFSIIGTTGAVLQIRRAHRRLWGLMPWAGVGEWFMGIWRVQNKGGSTSEGVGEVVSDWRWTYGWNWSSRKVPSRDQGEEIANLDRGIKAVKSGSGGRDLEIGIRAVLWLTDLENRTKPSLFLSQSCFVQHLKNCIRKCRSLMCKNTFINTKKLP